MSGFNCTLIDFSRTIWRLSSVAPCTSLPSLNSTCWKKCVQYLTIYNNKIYSIERQNCPIRFWKIDKDFKHSGHTAWTSKLTMFEELPICTLFTCSWNSSRTARWTRMYCSTVWTIAIRWRLISRTNSYRENSEVSFPVLKRPQMKSMAQMVPVRPQPAEQWTC